MDRKSFIFRLFWLLVLVMAGILVTYVLTFAILTLARGGDLTAVLTGFVTRVGDLWLMQGLQALFVFCLPPLLLCRIGRENTASWLSWRHARGGDLLVAAFSMVAALPLINVLVAWNESWQLPACLSGVEAWMQQQEQAAAQVTDRMVGETSPTGLLLNFGVIALLAGLGEEMLFRGTLQRLLAEAFSPRRRRAGPAVSRGSVVGAIWLTAFLFSAIHLQFYGLVPRMLLGAWLGYLLWWTGSLWVPVLAHALNNAVSLSFGMAANRGWLSQESVDSLGLGGSWWLCVVSVLALAGCVCYFGRSRRQLP